MAAMAEPTAGRGVAPSDLGSYQHAVRLVLTYDLITASRPRAGALATVLRWADLMSRDFAELLGYTLIATAHQVRLVRRLDTVDATQRSVFASRGGRPFDRRRLAYLCLVLAVFQRSRIEISLADLVRSFAPTANAIEGLGFEATITEHKRAVVDVLDWLADHGALRLSDGSVAGSVVAATRRLAPSGPHQPRVASAAHQVSVCPSRKVRVTACQSPGSSGPFQASSRAASTGVCAPAP
jgi:hypothetical protein